MKNMIFVFLLPFLSFGFVQNVLLYDDDFNYRQGHANMDKSAFHEGAFSFIYHGDNKLNMILVLKNVQNDIKMEVYFFEYKPDIRKHRMLLEYDLIRSKTALVSYFMKLSNKDEVQVVLELEKNGLLAKTNIALGRRHNLLSLVTKTGVCLRAHPCYVVVDISEINFENEDKDKVTSKKTVTQVADVDQNSAIVNETVDTPTVSESHIEGDAKSAVAPITTTIIISAVSVSVIIALIIIAFWKYFGKRETQNIPQTHELSERYYENVVFRRPGDNCEIAQDQMRESEEPHYEEITT